MAKKILYSYLDSLKINRTSMLWSAKFSKLTVQHGKLSFKIYQGYAPGTLFDWSFKVVQEKLCNEVVELSAESNGLHFTIAKATSQYLEGSFMQMAAKTMLEKAPSVWKIVESLLDANLDS
jgi:hypothetical protein